MSGRLSCKRRAGDSTTSLAEDMTQEELDITDDFCEPSVTFRAPKKPKYSRKAAVKPNEQGRNLRSDSSSSHSKSSKADKENVNVVPEKSRIPVTVVYTIDDDDDDDDSNGNVPLSPAKQALKLVKGNDRLVKTNRSRKSRSCKESLSSRLTKSLPTAVSNENTGFDFNLSNGTRGNASSSQVSRTSSFQDESTSKYFRATRSRKVTSRKAPLSPTESQSSSAVTQGLGPGGQVSTSENDGSEDDLTGLPSTAEDPELANIEKFICGVDEKLCPCCKHIVASATYGTHLRQCFKQFQCYRKLQTDSSADASARPSLTKPYADGGEADGLTNSKTAPSAAVPSTSRSSSAAQSDFAVSRQHLELETGSSSVVRSGRMLSGTRGGLLQFEGQDESEQNLLLKPLQNQPCMVRVRRGVAAASGGPARTRRSRKKKTTTLTALQTTTATQRGAFLQRRLELIKAWRPSNDEFDKVTRGLKKRGRRRVCEAVSLLMSQDKPLWSLTSQEPQDVSSYYVAELAPHIVPPAEGSAANITLHRALSQIPGRINVTQNLNLDSDDEEYQHILGYQDSFMNNSLTETQRVLADLLRSQASLFLDATGLDSTPRASLPAATESTEEKPTDMLNETSLSSPSVHGSLKKCTVLLKRTPIKEILRCGLKSANNTLRNECLSTSKTSKREDSLDISCDVEVLRESPGPPKNANSITSAEREETNRPDSPNNSQTSRDVKLNESKVSVPSSNFDESRRMSVSPDILRALKPVRVELTRLAKTSSGLQFHRQPEASINKESLKISSDVLRGESPQVNVELSRSTETDDIQILDHAKSGEIKTSQSIESDDHKTTFRDDLRADKSSIFNPVPSCDVDADDGSTMTFEMHQPGNSVGPTQSFQGIPSEPEDCSRSGDLESKNVEMRERESNKRDEFDEQDVTSISEKNVDNTSGDVSDGKENILSSNPGITSLNTCNRIEKSLNLKKISCESSAAAKDLLRDSKAENFSRDFENPVDDQAFPDLSRISRKQRVNCLDSKTGVDDMSFHSKTTEIFFDDVHDSLSKSGTSRATSPHTSTQLKCRKTIIPPMPDLSLVSSKTLLQLDHRSNISEHNMNATRELITKPLLIPVQDATTDKPLRVLKQSSLINVPENESENQTGENVLPEETADVPNVIRKKLCTVFKNITLVPDSDASDENVPASYIQNSQMSNKFQERTLSNFSVKNVSKLNSCLNDCDIATNEFRELSLQRYFTSLPKNGFDKIPSSNPEGSTTPPEVCATPTLESSMKFKLNEDFRKLLHSGANADATIITEQSSIPVHSLVLFARSPPLYDELILASKSKRKLQWRVSYKCAKLFLLYIYSGTLEMIDSNTDVLEIYKLSIRYKCSDLSDYLLKRYSSLSTSMKKVFYQGEKERTIVSPSPEIESVESPQVNINNDLREKQASGLNPFKRNASNDVMDEVASVLSLTDEKCSSNRVSKLDHMNSFSKGAEPVIESVSQHVTNPTPTQFPVCGDSGSVTHGLQIEDSFPLSDGSSKLACDGDVRSQQSVNACGTHATTLKNLEAADSVLSKNRSVSPDLFEDFSDDLQDKNAPQTNTRRPNETLRDESEPTKAAIDLRSKNKENCSDISDSKLLTHPICENEVIDITQSDSSESQSTITSRCDNVNENLPLACKENFQNKVDPQTSVPEIKDKKSPEAETSRLIDKYNQSTDVESVLENRAASVYLSNIWDDFEGGNGYEMGDVSLTPVKSLNKSSSPSKKDSNGKTVLVESVPQSSKNETRQNVRVHRELNSTAIDDKNDQRLNFPDVSIVQAFADNAESSVRSSTFRSSAKRKLCNEAQQKYDDPDFYNDSDCDLLSELELDALEIDTSLNTRLLRRRGNAENHASSDNESFSVRRNEVRLKQASVGNFSSKNAKTQLSRSKSDTNETSGSSQIPDRPTQKKPFAFKAPKAGSLALNNEGSSRDVIHHRVNQLRRSPRSTTTPRGTAPTTPGVPGPDTPQSTGTPITPRPDYSNMASPELKKALDNFGVRPLARAKARALLKHIYDQTHPVVNTPAPLASERPRSSVYTSTPVSRSRAGVSRPEEGSGSQTQVPTGEIPQATSPCSRLPRGVEHSVSDDTYEGCAEESVLLSQNDSDGNVDSPQEKGTIHEQLRSLISSDRSLYEAVLLYQPVWLHHIKQMAVAAGIKCSTATLVDFLDQQCITFRMGVPGQGSNARTRKKLKKRRLPLNV